MSSTTLPFVPQPGDDELIDKFHLGLPLSPDEEYRLLQIAQADIAENDREQLNQERPL